MVLLQVCILGVCLIARPQLETDKHKAHLHLAGIIVGLFQAFFSGMLIYTRRRSLLLLLREVTGLGVGTCCTGAVPDILKIPT